MLMWVTQRHDSAAETAMGGGAQLGDPGGRSTPSGILARAVVGDRSRVLQQLANVAAMVKLSLPRLGLCAEPRAWSGYRQEQRSHKRTAGKCLRGTEMLVNRSGERN